MFGFAQRRKEPIDRKRSLEGIPVVTPGLEIDDRDPDRLILTLKVKRGSGLLSRFQPPVMERNVKLDALGSFVFRTIDGKRTVRDIINRFTAKYNINRREAELSCVEFVKMLLKRNVISIVIK